MVARPHCSLLGMWGEGMSLLGRFLQPGAMERRTLTSSSFVPPPAVGVIDDFVGVHRAMANMTVFACVRLLADTIASLPWKAYRRDGQGVPKEVKPQPAIINQPFPGFDLFEWKWMTVASMALRGNAYSYITSRDKFGYPTAILPLHPDIVFLERRPDILMWFDPIYRIMGEMVDRKDMLHMRRFTMPGEPWGLSPIRQAAVAIGLGMSAEEFGYRFYKESATPSGTLSTEQDLDPDAIEALQQNWIQSHGGRRLPAILTKGFKFDAISLRPDECLARGTLLTMADGTRKAVEDITVGDRVMAWNGSKIVASRVGRVGSPPIKPMVKITTARGRELVCTADHPMLGLRELSYPQQKEPEWILAGDLQPGHHVRVALGHLSDDVPGFHKGIAYFLGAMVGDGNIRKGHPRWYTQDPGVYDRMSAAVDEMGGRIVPEGSRNYGIRMGSRRGSLISAILTESGLNGLYSHEKFVPEMVMAGGPSAWRGFLSGYLDADGYVTREDAETPRVTVNCTSQELLNDVQHLMALLGVNASVTYKPAGRGRRAFPGGTYDCREQWTLNVTGIRQVQKLAEQLDVSHTEKRSRLDGYIARSGNTLRRETTDPYDRVKSVELLGEGQSIGLTIENTHTHVTNGLISHNSQFLETRQFQRSEICLLYGVPPILIGDTKECVVAGTLMTMANGTRKPVEELCVGERVVAWNGSKLVASRVKWVGTPPVKPIVKLTTVRGRELTCTADHPVLGLKRLRSAGNRPLPTEGEWLWAGELQPGQYVRIALGHLPEETGHLSADIGYFLGEMVGDGHIRLDHKHYSCWANTNADVIDRMRTVVESLGGSLKFRSHRSFDLLNSGSRSVIGGILRESGLIGSHAPDKFVPDMIMAGGPVAWRGFLSGYFDADGCMSTTAKQPCAHWGSASRELLEGCQHLLALLGINSAIYLSTKAARRTMPRGGESDCRDAWQLRVKGRSELAKLAEVLDLAHVGKKTQLASFLGDQTERSVRPVVFEYDRVKNVEYLGDGQTVGIEIEGTHTHVTNGIISHNTTAWGCLPGSALVFTLNGPVPIVNIKKGDEVWSFDGQQMKTAKVTGWVMTGYKPLMTIRTRGRELEVTSNHRVPVRRYFGVPDGRIAGNPHRKGTCGWETIEISAGEIREGDYLIVPHGMSDGERHATSDGQDLSVGRMEIAGLYLGDGNRDKGRIEIAHGYGRDEDHMPHYRQIIEREFGVVPYTDDRGTRTRFSSAEAITLIEAGFTGTAATKRLPGWVFRLAPELQLALLRGYLDSDGSVQHGKISYSSCNKLLLEDIRHLCIQLGIPVGKIKLGRSAGHALTNNGQPQDKWELALSSTAHNSRIGSNSPHKAARFRDLPTQRRLRYDDDWTGVRKPIGKPPEGTVYHKVISIKHGTAEVPVYDIEVDGLAHYVADGIVVHNTGVQQITLGAVTYTFRPWTSCIESVISGCLPRGQFVRFDYNALLRGDVAARYDTLKTGIEGTFLTPNEARASEEMDPLPNGDDLLQPTTFMKLGTPPGVVSGSGTGPPRPATPAPKKTPRPATLPMPPVGGGENNPRSGNGHHPDDPLVPSEQETRRASDSIGKDEGTD
jgi:phage portal protein BeeE